MWGKTQCGKADTGGDTYKFWTNCRTKKQVLGKLKSQKAGIGKITEPKGRHWKLYWANYRAKSQVLGKLYIYIYTRQEYQAARDRERQDATTSTRTDAGERGEDTRRQLENALRIMQDRDEAGTNTYIHTDTPTHRHTYTLGGRQERQIVGESTMKYGRYREGQYTLLRVRICGPPLRVRICGPPWRVRICGLPCVSGFVVPRCVSGFVAPPACQDLWPPVAY